MEPAVFSAASLFHGADDSDDDRDEMQVDAKGKKQALDYAERAHDFPGMKLSVREFSSHELNANFLWPGTFSFATWLVKNQSILDGQRVLEFGSGTGALAIFLRKSFGVDITTSDYDDKEIEENIAYNCSANNLDVLPHIRRSRRMHHLKVDNCSLMLLFNPQTHGEIHFQFLDQIGTLLLLVIFYSMLNSMPT
ncbi:unnamed protein product [Urochloa decumbens]|uniref:Uncharacterized protein n=1 Tax=Urochloa decumbens TaxID=240449 RepID=A0ABC8X4I2_9POAL